MKKICLIVLALVVCFNSYVYALDNALLGMRDTIFNQSKDLKSILVGSKDVVLVNTMWDSCIITMSQLDAYFYMAGIIDTIKKEELKEEAVNYLIKWLEGIKKTNEVNIKSLDSLTIKLEETTIKHKSILIDYFSNLNKEIDKELEKIAALKQSLKKG